MSKLVSDFSVGQDTLCLEIWPWLEGKKWIKITDWITSLSLDQNLQSDTLSVTIKAGYKSSVMQLLVNTARDDDIIRLKINGSISFYGFVQTISVNASTGQGGETIIQITIRAQGWGNKLRNTGVFFAFTRTKEQSAPAQSPKPTDYQVFFKQFNLANFFDDPNSPDFSGFLEQGSPPLARVVVHIYPIAEYDEAFSRGKINYSKLPKLPWFHYAIAGLGFSDGGDGDPRSDIIKGLSPSRVLRFIPYNEDNLTGNNLTRQSEAVASLPQCIEGFQNAIIILLLVPDDISLPDGEAVPYEIELARLLDYLQKQGVWKGLTQNTNYQPDIKLCARDIDHLFEITALSYFPLSTTSTAEHGNVSAEDETAWKADGGLSRCQTNVYTSTAILPAQWPFEMTTRPVFFDINSHLFDVDPAGQMPPLNIPAVTNNWDFRSKLLFVINSILEGAQERYSKKDFGVSLRTEPTAPPPTLKTMPLIIDIQKWEKIREKTLKMAQGDIAKSLREFMQMILEGAYITPETFSDILSLIDWDYWGGEGLRKMIQGSVFRFISNALTGVQTISSFMRLFAPEGWIEVVYTYGDKENQPLKWVLRPVPGMVEEMVPIVGTISPSWYHQIGWTRASHNRATYYVSDSISPALNTYAILFANIKRPIIRLDDLHVHGLIRQEPYTPYYVMKEKLMDWLTHWNEIYFQRVAALADSLDVQVAGNGVSPPVTDFKIGDFAFIQLPFSVRFTNKEAKIPNPRGMQSGYDAETDYYIGEVSEKSLTFAVDPETGLRTLEWHIGLRFCQPMDYDNKVTIDDYRAGGK